MVGVADSHSDRILTGRNRGGLQTGSVVRLKSEIGIMQIEFWNPASAMENLEQDLTREACNLPSRNLGFWNSSSEVGIQGIEF